ncbi:MAG: hypothetical protein R3213_13030, partial [Flavobacteriaceae bacterium]|nr:hypothetical protein [Flavobacteriaceae bacterium]
WLTCHRFEQTKTILGTTNWRVDHVYATSDICPSGNFPGTRSDDKTTIIPYLRGSFVFSGNSYIP